MIQFGLGGLVVASGSIACVMILTGPDIIGALFWIVVAAFVICFVINIQDSVAFAASNLATAAAAIKKYRQVCAFIMYVVNPPCLLPSLSSILPNPSIPLSLSRPFRLLGMPCLCSWFGCQFGWLLYSVTLVLPLFIL